MGQYFKMVNIDKKEYLRAYCCDDGAKFQEIITGNMPSLMAYLIRQSQTGGGGDIPIVEDMNEVIPHIKQKLSEAQEKHDVKDIDFYAKQLNSYTKELAYAKKIKYAGRWAGDRIVLVGDYDSSRLYQEAHGMENITHEVMEEYNEFVYNDEYRIFTPDYHKCEKYRSKENRQELYGHIENTKTMIKEGRYVPASSGYEEIERVKEGIELMQAEDEYYGKYKEPKWNFQRPKGPEPKRQSKGMMAPDMILTAKGSDE